MNHACRGRKKTGPARIKTRLRQAKAVQLRMEGRTLAEIADALGFAGPSGARYAIEETLARECREPAADLRAIENERLDMLFKTHFPIAVNPDPELEPAKSKERIESAKIVLRVMERRAKINGLDAPMRAEIGPAPAKNLVTLFKDPENREAAKMLSKRLEELNDGRPGV